MKVFPTSLRKWFLIGVWVTASISKSPELFSVFWPILIMRLFGWPPLVLVFPGPPVPLSILWWLCQVNRLQLVSPSLSIIIISTRYKLWKNTCVCVFNWKYVCVCVCFTERICVCMFYWAYICECVCVLLRIHVCVCVCVCVCFTEHICVCFTQHMCIFHWVCVCVCLLLSKYVCMYVCLLLSMWCEIIIIQDFCTPIKLTPLISKTPEKKRNASVLCLLLYPNVNLTWSSQ